MPTSAAATYEDVNLILRLYEMRREEKLRKARDWFSRNCKGLKTMEDLAQLAAPGTEENVYVRMVTTYWDMVASFVTQGVLHRELFFQSSRELLLVYLRIEPILPAMREATADKAALRNLETVARELAAWWEGRSPGAVAAFRTRIGA